MPVQLPENLIVSVSGFRGTVGPGHPLTPELMASLGAAYGGYLSREGVDGVVVVGRDSRTSGLMLSRALISGLLSVGRDVVDLGIVPTPTLMLAVEELGAAGGVGVTASHNPAHWNALKLASAEGMFLDAEGSARFQGYLRAEDPKRAPWDGLGTLTHEPGWADRHLERILALDLVDVDAIRDRGFAVALDCVRGAGGTIMPQLLDRLGCRVTAIGLEPDGRFPRDPEPTADHLTDLCDLVRTSGADIGLAVDPDVDRLSLVDETGRALGEDLTLALASAAVLGRRPGTVVTNLSTSQVLEDVAVEHDARLVRAPVGEINVARRMQAEGAVIGGEGNGGVILPDLHLTRDAPAGAALILQYLADRTEPVSRLASAWPDYRIVKEKVTFPRESVVEAYGVLENRFADGEPDRSDGLRLSWPGAREWLHVRPSGTEPVVRLIAEAPDEGRARSLIDEARMGLEAARTSTQNILDRGTGVPPSVV